MSETDSRLPLCPACESQMVFSKSRRGAGTRQREYPQQYRCQNCYAHFDASRLADGWTHSNVHTP